MGNRRMRRTIGGSYGSISCEVSNYVTGYTTTVSNTTSFYDVNTVTVLGDVSGADFIQSSNGALQYKGPGGDFTVEVNFSAGGAGSIGMFQNLKINGTAVTGTGHYGVGISGAQEGWSSQYDVTLATDDILTGGVRNASNTNNLTSFSYSIFAREK